MDLSAGTLRSAGQKVRTEARVGGINSDATYTEVYNENL